MCAYHNIYVNCKLQKYRYNHSFKASASFFAFVLWVNLRTITNNSDVGIWAAKYWLNFKVNGRVGQASVLLHLVIMPTIYKTVFNYLHTQYCKQ